VAIFEFFHQAEVYLDAVRFLQPGWPAIVDSVDLHYLREARMATYESGRTTPKALQERRARELRVYANADLVLTVTEDERQRLRRDLPGAEVAVVPNIHRPRAVLPALAGRRRRSLLFVGGFQHAPNADAVLWFVREVLPQLRRVVPDVEVVMVGDCPPPEIRKLEESPGVRATGYVPDTTPYLDAAWVSIAPLRYGAGMKGKVGEAMAAGLPVVTTSIGAEGMELEDGVTALVADTPEAFADAVHRLCTDDALHQRISARALAHVRERYDLPVVAARLEAAVKRATTLEPRRMGLAARVAFLARVARQKLAPLHSGTKRGSRDD
jgi:glycosyltransferase involved in cell wall biosynthesis